MATELSCEGPDERVAGVVVAVAANRHCNFAALVVYGGFGNGRRRLRQVCVHLSGSRTSHLARGLPVCC